MNRITLLGRLVRDPEVRYTPNSRMVCQFTLAVDRPFANTEGQREADFIPIVIWGKQAEICGKNLQKGHRALVEGRLQIRSYDAKDGTRKYITEVIADKFEFIERKSDINPSTSANTNDYQQPTYPTSQPTYQEQSAFDQMGNPVPFDEEIPF